MSNLDPQIKAWLRQKVVVEPFIKNDGRGKPTYGDSRTLACYISGERKMVRDNQGQEVVSMESLFFEGTIDAQAIRSTDRLTMPDGKRPPIIAIQPFRGEFGHVEFVEVNV